MLQAVIFDMDGLLLDSERDAVDAWVEIARRHGYAMPPELVASTCGCDARDTKRIITDQMPAGFAYDALRAERNALMQAWYAERGILLRPTVRAFLAELQARAIPYAIGTSTARERARERLRLAGVEDEFPILARPSSSWPLSGWGRPLLPARCSRIPTMGSWRRAPAA